MTVFKVTLSMPSDRAPLLITSKRTTAGTTLGAWLKSMVTELPCTPPARGVMVTVCDCVFVILRYKSTIRSCYAPDAGSNNADPDVLARLTTTLLIGVPEASLAITVKLTGVVPSATWVVVLTVATTLVGGVFSVAVKCINGDVPLTVVPVTPIVTVKAFNDGI